MGPEYIVDVQELWKLQPTMSASWLVVEGTGIRRILGSPSPLESWISLSLFFFKFPKEGIFACVERKSPLDSISLLVYES